MTNELFPLSPEPETPQKPPSPLKRFYGKNALFAGLILSLMAGMGVYVFVSPTQERTVVTATVILTPTPTLLAPTPTVLPTNTPLPPPPTSTPIPTPTTIPTPTIPPGTAWKTYANTKQGYRIKYSPDWTVRDLGELEPKIPSYIAFNDTSASTSSRFITVSVTTRTYEEQLALGASSSAITVAGIKGTKQYFKDSDGNTSTVVILPRRSDLIVLRAKTAYLTIFNLMLSTLYVAK